MGLGALQHTVATPAALVGRGVHSGARVKLAVHAAARDSGVSFVRTDVKDNDNRVAPSAQAVVDTRLHTEIANGEGVRVATIEHIMAALVMSGVDNAVVELDGTEVPMMDGSSTPFVVALQRAGLRVQDAPRRYIEVLERVEVCDGDKRVALAPQDGFEGLSVDVEIAFDSAAIGRQRLFLDIDDHGFRTQLAPARSFGFIDDVERLRAAGLARGGDLSNVIVIDGDRVMNPEGLRFPDEFVRHKALDAVGDLFVLGAPLVARYEGRCAGHALNNALARALQARPQAWRTRTFAAEFAEAG